MRKLSNEQAALLKMKIMFSEDIKSEMARKAILWLMGQTQNMRHNVIMRLQDGTHDYDDLAQEIAHSIHDMNSSCRTTDLYGFKKKNGLEQVRFTGGGGKDKTYYTSISWVNKDFEIVGEEVLVEPNFEGIIAIPLTFLGQDVAPNKKPPRQIKEPTSWADFDASAEKPADLIPA